MQSLDMTVYSILKGTFKRECDFYMKLSRLLRMTPYDQAGLFNSSYSTVATMAIAMLSFKATRIYSINPTNLLTDEDFLAADELLGQAETSLSVIVNDESILDSWTFLYAQFKQ